MLDSAPVRTLSRHLVARFLVSTFTTLLGLLAVVAVAEVLLHADDILESGAWLAGIARHLGLKIPAVYLRILIPAAAFAGAFATFGLAARWREITAMKAAGISPRRAAVPVLLAALALSLASFLVSETVVLRAVRAWDRHERGDDDQEKIVFRRGSFWYHRGRVIYNIRYADPDTNTWRGVSVFELDERGLLERSIRARRVHIDEGDRWLFQDLTIRRFDPDQPLAPPTFERLERSFLELSEDADSALREADAAHLTLPDLLAYVQVAEREGGAPASAQARLHERLADPLTLLLFTIFAVPLGVRVEESRSLAISALAGVGMIAAFLFLRAFGDVLVREGLAPAAATVWGIAAAFTAAGMVVFARMPR